MLCSPGMLSRRSGSSDRLCWCASPTFACSLTEDLSVRDPCGACLACVFAGLSRGRRCVHFGWNESLQPGHLWTLICTVSRSECELASDYQDISVVGGPHMHRWRGCGACCTGISMNLLCTVSRWYQSRYVQCCMHVRRNGLFWDLQRAQPKSRQLA